MSINSAIQTLLDMIEEAQREANYCMNPDDRRQILAKRDALTEFKLRVRDGRIDPHWTRRASR